MAGPTFRGTFTTGLNPVAGVASDVLNPPSGMTAAYLSTKGLDANNTIKLQKRSSPGGTWVDQSTYSSDQTETSIAVTDQEEWRAVSVSLQATKEIRYSFTVIPSTLPTASPPLRYVTTGNRIASSTLTFTGTQLGAAIKDVHYIGSGDVSGFYIEINNWALEQSTFSPFTIPEMWVTIDGSSTGVAVKWGGATSTTVPAGAVQYLSDQITPAMFSLTKFARGTKLYIGYRAEVASGAVMPGEVDRNPASNSSIRYTPGYNSIGNLQGSGTLSWSPADQVSAIGDVSYPCVTVVGNFVDGDHAVFAGIGDSITWGYGTSSTSYVPGFFYQSLFDNFSTFSNPRAGITIAKVGTNASIWTEMPTGANLAAIVKRANYFVERYGINFISSDGGQSGANTLIASRKSAIWDVIRANPAAGGRAPIICALPLTPHTNSTDSWATVANQTPTAGCGLGQEIAFVDSTMKTIVGTSSGPDYYIDNTAAVRGGTDNTLASYWTWGISGGANTTDGLHPNATAYALMCPPLVTWMQSVA